MSKDKLGIFYIIISSVSFGIMPILAKFAYMEGVTTFTLLFLRFLFASVIIFGYLKIKHKKSGIKRVQLLYVLALGVFGYSITALSMFTAYKYISVGLATMILYTYPAVVTLITVIFFKEKLQRDKLVSLILSLTGVYLLAANGFGSGLNFKGILLSLLASFFYALYVIGVSQDIIKDIDSFVISFYVSLAASITMLIAGISNGNLDLHLTIKAIIYITLLAIISTVVALMTFVQGVKIIGASKSAILGNLEPIVSLILSCIIFNDKLTVNIIAGSMLVILSIVILSLKKDKLLVEQKESV